MLKKKTQVVMLPTKEKANIYLNEYADDKNKADKLVFGGSIKGELNSSIKDLENRGYKAQHLYFLSLDEQIKGNDFFIMNGFVLRQCDYIDGYMIIDKGGGKHHVSVCKKVIAST